MQHCTLTSALQTQGGRTYKEKGAEKKTQLGVLGITLCFLRQRINRSLLIPRQKVPLVITISVTLWLRLSLTCKSVIEDHHGLN